MMDKISDLYGQSNVNKPLIGKRVRKIVLLNREKSPESVDTSGFAGLAKHTPTKLNTVACNGEEINMATSAVWILPYRNSREDNVILSAY